MKLFVAFACLLAVVAAIDDVKVISSENDVKTDGYNYGYVLDNGQELTATGKFSDPDDGLAASGSFKYTAPDGQVISLSYIANDEGFQPTGDHVPTIPPLIQRGLDYLEEHAPLPILVVNNQAIQLTREDLELK